MLSSSRANKQDLQIVPLGCRRLPLAKLGGFRNGLYSPDHATSWRKTAIALSSASGLSERSGFGIAEPTSSLAAALRASPSRVSLSRKMRRFSSSGRRLISSRFSRLATTTVIVCGLRSQALARSALLCPGLFPSSQMQKYCATLSPKG